MTKPMDGTRQRTQLCVALLGLVIAACAPTRATAAESQDKLVAPIWRPLIADPREAEFKMQWVTFREDWRFGTDVADSTTHGGYTREEGVYWDVSFGNSFHLVASGADHDSTGRSTLSQVGMMAAVFADFAHAGAMLTNADYQVGPTLDLRFGGHDPHSVVPNGDACWSLRALLFHRSTHLGDEYISQGAFGRNQSSSDSSHLFRFPPVKRVNLSFQAFRVTIARETPLRRSGPNRSLLRIYGGLELKTRIKQIPKHFSSPIYQAGLELYGGEGEKDIEPRGVARMVNGALGWFNLPLITGEALMGVDMKVAKPYAFASVDNPSGYEEVWTPNLYSQAPHGREYSSYATSWHGIFGYRFFLRSWRTALSSGAPSLTISWQLYSGYSPNGQFLDQRLFYRPYLYAVPSISFGI